MIAASNQEGHSLETQDLVALPLPQKGVIGLFVQVFRCKSGFGE